MSRRTCQTIVESFVLSHLNYCAPLLQGINGLLTTRLQAILNTSIRVICGLKKHDSVSSWWRSTCGCQSRSTLTWEPFFCCIPSSQQTNPRISQTLWRSTYPFGISALRTRDSWLFHVRVQLLATGHSASPLLHCGMRYQWRYVKWIRGGVLSNVAWKTICSLLVDGDCGVDFWGCVLCVCFFVCVCVCKWNCVCVCVVSGWSSIYTWETLKK